MHHPEEEKIEDLQEKVVEDLKGEDQLEKEDLQEKVVEELQKKAEEREEPLRDYLEPEEVVRSRRVAQAEVIGEI